MIYFLLFASICLNIFFTWFTYKMVVKLSNFVVMFEDIEFKIDLFSKHISSLYELEMFYGDPNLERLVEHSKELILSFDEFKEDYKVINGDEIDE